MYAFLNADLALQLKKQWKPDDPLVPKVPQMKTEDEEAVEQEEEREEDSKHPRPTVKKEFGLLRKVEEQEQDEEEEDEDGCVRRLRERSPTMKSVSASVESDASHCSSPRAGPSSEGSETQERMPR